jgi:hypothetical protein
LTRTSGVTTSKQNRSITRTLYTSSLASPALGRVVENEHSNQDRSLTYIPGAFPTAPTRFIQLPPPECLQGECSYCSNIRAEEEEEEEHQRR